MDMIKGIRMKRFKRNEVIYLGTIKTPEKAGKYSNTRIHWRIMVENSIRLFHSINLRNLSFGFGFWARKNPFLDFRCHKYLQFHSSWVLSKGPHHLSQLRSGNVSTLISIKLMEGGIVALKEKVDFCWLDRTNDKTLCQHEKKVVDQLAKI